MRDALDPKYTVRRRGLRERLRASEARMSAEPLLRISDLSVDYAVGGDATLRALAHVDLELGQGEVLGIVGESGCGKSTLGHGDRAPAAGQRLAWPAARSRSTGATSLRLGAARDAGRARARCGGDLPGPVDEPQSHALDRRAADCRCSARTRRPAAADGQRCEQRALEKLDEVGIPDARRALARHPHEFSGGMRQRVMIAMALLLEPRLIIADEATSALDVTLEAQILELLLRLRDDHGTAMLFISHDLGVVSQRLRSRGRDVRRARRRGDRRARTRSAVRGTRIPRRSRRPCRIRACADSDSLPSPARCRASSVNAVHSPIAAATRTSRCLAAEPPLYPTAGGATRCYLYDPSVGAGAPRPHPTRRRLARARTRRVVAVPASLQSAAAGSGPDARRP